MQIVKNQIHRYQSTGPVECDKELDPKLVEEGDVEFDKQSKYITLVIVLTAFFISPLTECLGPVLELNVSNICGQRICEKFKLTFYLPPPPKWLKL